MTGQQPVRSLVVATAILAALAYTRAAAARPLEPGASPSAGRARAPVVLSTSKTSLRAPAVAATTVFGSRAPSLRTTIEAVGVTEVGAAGFGVRHAGTTRIHRAARECVVTSPDYTGPNTLHACIDEAVEGDVITFDPTVFPPDAPRTIEVAGIIPAIQEDRVVVDASNAGVVIDGSALPEHFAGIFISGARDVVVRGLHVRGYDRGIFVGFGVKRCTIGGDRSVGSGPSGQGNILTRNRIGIHIQDPETSDCVVAGNLIGTDPSSAADIGNEIGVGIVASSQHTIGGAHTAGKCDGACNVISGNTVVGALVHSEAGHATDGNRIFGNFVGTNSLGTAALPNRRGVEIGSGGTNTRVGGGATTHGNVISGNEDDGVLVSGETVSGTVVLGNIVGLDATGSSAVANYTGVLVESAIGTTIGGRGRGEGNVISGNQRVGLNVGHHGAPGNVVQGNLIGTDITGKRAIPNLAGLVLTAGSGNQIGGTEPGEGNLVSGNHLVGVQLELSSNDNVLTGNMIGTDIDGAAAVPNGGDGVLIGFGSSRNTFGGTSAGAGNLVSGNAHEGVQVQEPPSVGNIIAGNRVGTDREGMRAVPNRGAGIVVIGAPDTRIGGDHSPGACSGACNLISGNAGRGVGIQGESATLLEQRAASDLRWRARRARTPALRATVGPTTPLAVEIVGNFIGTDADGEVPIPNAAGVILNTMAAGVIVGGLEPEDGNLVSGNLEGGIAVANTGAAPNRLLGNRIGTTADGKRALPNEMSGVELSAGSRDVEVAGNTIGGNAGAGVLVCDSTENLVHDNRIGVSATLLDALPNTYSGIQLGMPDCAAQRNRIGPGNVIASNQSAGVLVAHPDALTNTITRNAVFRNGAGEIVFFGFAAPVASPRLTRWEDGHLFGTTCGGCMVEVFATRTGEAAGYHYLGTVAAAAGGAFDAAVRLDALDLGLRDVSATVTRGDGTTSAFASSVPARELFFAHLPAALARDGG